MVWRGSSTGPTKTIMVLLRFTKNLLFLTNDHVCSPLCKENKKDMTIMLSKKI